VLEYILLTCCEKKCTYEITVLFRRHPNVTITPFTQFTQFLHFGMLMLHIVLDRQPSRIKNTHIST
jgi:hypothetical protein